MLTEGVRSGWRCLDPVDTSRRGGSPAWSAHGHAGPELEAEEDNATRGWARDAGTKDTIHLTGSGQAEPEEHSAAGGGTFIHRHANGSEVAHGIYYVTGFKSFVNAGGTLVGTLRIDGIGELEETTGGILKLHVHLIPSSGGSVEGLLGVHCNLPGTTDSSIIEGETLSIPSRNLKFVQEPNGGDNLFHALDR